MKKLKTILITAVAGATLALPIVGMAQENIEPKSAAGKTETAHAPYTKEQLLTATVHEAWLLSDKNEANFFEMVEQLAEISATNRGITLPDTAAAGRRLGEEIKRAARLDTDQLLFAVVDKAVRMTSPKPVHAAGAAR